MVLPGKETMSDDKADTTPNNDSESWVDELFSEIADGMDNRRGRVVIYDDDTSPAELVEALLAETITSDDPSRASYLMLKAHHEGHAVIYDGSLATADLMQWKLQRGGTDLGWVATLRSHVPSVGALYRTLETLVQITKMAADSDDIAPPQMMTEGASPQLVAMIRSVMDGEDPEKTVGSWVATQPELARPKLRVVVVADDDDIPTEWPGN